MKCIFCSIIRGEIPTKKIYEDETLISVLDIAPKSKGSCIVFPKKHYEFPWEEIETSKKVFEVAINIGNVIKSLFNPSFVSISYLPSQSRHFNLKLLPYYKDAIPLVESRPKETDESELEAIKEKIEKALKNRIKKKDSTGKQQTAESSLSTSEVEIIKRELLLP